MWKIFFLLLSVPCFAYTPPGFYLAQKIVSGRDSGNNLFLVEVYRAAPSAKEADELLWDQYLQLGAGNSSESPWPGLSILAESDMDRLVTAFKKFGLPVISEESLAKFRGEQLRSMKETPRPFYNTDQNMSLRRDNRQIAWVLSSPDGSRSLWMEKNSLFPLFLRGPCPKSVEEISWAKGGDSPCDLRFESISGIKTSAGKRTAAVLTRNGQPLIKFVIKRAMSAQGQSLKDYLEKNSKSTERAGDLLSIVTDFMN
jgi:hypothetical protein